MLDEVIDLLSTANIRVSIFSFEARYGSIDRARLQAAVAAAIEDSGIVFEFANGRIGGLVFACRPPGADDRWVEMRTVDRLNLALGGSCAAADLVDVAAIHVPSAGLCSSSDIEALAETAY